MFRMNMRVIAICSFVGALCSTTVVANKANNSIRVTTCLSQAAKIELGPSGYATVCVNISSDSDVPQLSSMTIRASRQLPSGASVPCVPSLKALWAPTRLSKGVAEEAVYEIGGCGTTSGILDARLLLPSASAAVELQVVPARTDAARSVIYGSGTIAGVWMSLILVVLLIQGYRWEDVIGTATWDFGRSWASNIAAAGAILGFLVSGAFYPDRPVHLSKENYLAVNALALGLAALAPFVYQVSSHLERAGAQLQNQGRVYGFLVASAFTVWSVLAQLWTQWYALNEAVFAVTALQHFVALARVLILALGVMLLCYAVRRFLELVGSSASRSADASQTRISMASLKAAPLSRDDAAGRSIPLL